MNIAPNPDEKWDFENLDVRLYLALRNLCKAVDDEQIHWPTHSPVNPAWAGAEKVMRDFNASFGPIPDWAVERNHGRELIPGAQLFTKNGRRTGNGWIVEIDVIAAGPVGVPVFKILTDAGSFMQLTEKELEDAFEVGDWICTRERIIQDFDRNGEFKQDV